MITTIYFIYCGLRDIVLVMQEFSNISKTFEGVEAVVDGEKRLEMYGGVWGGLVPLLILIVTLI